MADGGDSAGERVAIDPAIVNGVADHIARLAADDDPVARGLADYLSQASGVCEFIAGVANRRGHSFGEEAKTAQSHAAIRELGRTMIASVLRAGLLNYQGNNWQRDRGKPNPYSMPGPMFYYFKILTARDHVPSEGWLREIL